ncbi:MAG: hypothetical protein J6V25_01825 [Oscillospiraceae bacterium]|nr:hypothetical protein [Oscillospiraceae bacterium]
MENWQYLLVASVAVLLLLVAFLSGNRKRKARKERDFQRSLETLLQPRETIKIICPQKDCRCILTNKRIIFEKKESFTAYPFKSITKIQGINASGNRTTSVKNMVRMLIRIDQEYQLCNSCPEFTEAAALLQQKMKKQSQKKK